MNTPTSTTPSARLLKAVQHNLTARTVRALLAGPTGRPAAMGARTGRPHPARWPQSLVCRRLSDLMLPADLSAPETRLLAAIFGVRLPSPAPARPARPDPTCGPSSYLLPAAALLGDDDTPSTDRAVGARRPQHPPYRRPARLTTRELPLLLEPDDCDPLDSIDLTRPLWADRTTYRAAAAPSPEGRPWLCYADLFGAGATAEEILEVAEVDGIFETDPLRDSAETHDSLTLSLAQWLWDEGTDTWGAADTECIPWEAWLDMAEDIIRQAAAATGEDWLPEDDFDLEPIDLTLDLTTPSGRDFQPAEAQLSEDQLTDFYNTLDLAAWRQP